MSAAISWNDGCCWRGGPVPRVFPASRRSQPRKVESQSALRATARLLLAAAQSRMSSAMRSMSARERFSFAPSVKCFSFGRQSSGRIAPRFREWWPPSERSEDGEEGVVVIRGGVEGEEEEGETPSTVSRGITRTPMESVGFCVTISICGFAASRFACCRARSFARLASFCAHSISAISAICCAEKPRSARARIFSGFMAHPRQHDRKMFHDEHRVEPGGGCGGGLALPW